MVPPAQCHMSCQPHSTLEISEYHVGTFVDIQVILRCGDLSLPNMVKGSQSLHCKILCTERDDVNSLISTWAGHYAPSLVDSYLPLACGQL